MTVVNDIHALTERMTEFLDSTGRKKLTPELRAELTEAGCKLCYTCSSVKELSEFPNNRNQKDGKDCRCSECNRIAKRRYDNEHRDEIRRKDRERRKPVMKGPRYPIVEKVCPGCNELKRWNEYAANRSRHSGLDSRCRSCKAAYYQAHKQERDEYTNHYRNVINPWAERLSAGYSRAVKASLPAEKITTAQLLDYWKSKGIDASRSAYSGKPLAPGTWSLDHVTPLSNPASPGHVLSNLVPCLWAENDRKNTRHFVELLGTIHNPKEKDDN